VVHSSYDTKGSVFRITSEVVGRCFDRRRTKEFLKFMDQMIATHDGREIHVVLNNLSTHSGSDVGKWLTRHSNVTLHFTPLAARGSTK
jgi:hypothetical protein